MTPLTKAVSRRTVAPLGHYGRRMVVTLLPGDRIALRLERDRAHNAYVADISTVFRTMADWHAQAKILARKAARKAKR